MTSCPYCLKQFPFRQLVTKAKESKTLRARRIGVQFPCCAPCYTQVLSGAIPALGTASTVDLKARCTELRHLTNKFHRDTAWGILERAVKEADALKVLIPVEEKRLKEMLDQMQQLHAAIQNMKDAIAYAEEGISQTVGFSYKIARKLANKHIGTLHVREAVFAKCGNKCARCGSNKLLTVDHIIPVKRGGSNEMDNLQALCLYCNSKKGAKPHTQFK